MPRKKNIKYVTTQMNICTCGVEEPVYQTGYLLPKNTFTWADLGGHMVLLCWDCTDKLHKKFMADEKKHEV